MKQSGTFIISLDFELHWGVFGSVGPDSPYIKNLINTPLAIYRILELFKVRNISATWATVGFLFSESKHMLKDFEPSVKQIYDNSKSNPYLVEIGHNEKDDPIHFAPSIIKKIKSVPGQEIATHTFSHFLCRDKHASIEAFLSDLESAVKIAEMHGIKISSIVFPRNQLIYEFIEVLSQKHITIFRGAEKGWMYPGIRNKNDSSIKRTRLFLNKIGRFVDTYIPLTGANIWGLNELSIRPGMPINVPASRFLRPYNPRLEKMDWLKYLRIKYQIKHAAKNGKMFHLRWHPHNFGSYTEENISFLERILDYFEYCKETYGMQSRNMFEYSKLLK